MSDARDDYYDEKQLTVSELIAALLKLPPDARVYTEGCDCDGRAGAVELEGTPANPSVYILRA